MFFRSTLNYFFSSTSSERTPLLASNQEKPLNDVLIDFEDTAQTIVTVSKTDKQRSRNLATHPTKPRLGILREISTAIRLLKDSKKNLASYRKIEQTQLSCVGVINIVFILATPGVSFTLMFMLHQRLSAIVWRGLNTFLPSYQQAATFINWYNEVLNSINQEIYNREDPVGEKENPCVNQMMQRYPYVVKYDVKFIDGIACDSEHYIEMTTPHYSGPMPDYCAMNQTQYSNPECNQLTDYLCNAVGGVIYLHG